MKKKFCSAIFIFLVIISTFLYVSFAAENDGYSFKIEYDGKVEENVPKNANVSLIGTNAKQYDKVRIKVEIEGPATPKILATDSQNVTYDIAQIGYWGPDVGFQVGGTFENVTPVIVTYPKAGNYTIKLSLVDVSSEEKVITSEDFTTNVEEVAQEIEDNNVINNTVEEIPQTGVSIWTYIATIVLAVVLLYGVFRVFKK